MANKQIWKFPLTHEGAVEMPVGAKVLTVDAQFNERREEQAYLWALVDPDPRVERETRRFRTVGTGHQIANAEDLIFIGTFMFAGGALVFHVFEEQG